MADQFGGWDATVTPAVSDDELIEAARKLRLLIAANADQLEAETGRAGRFSRPVEEQPRTGQFSRNLWDQFMSADQSGNRPAPPPQPPRHFVGPTPEERGVFAPVVTPRGFSEPELGVPSFIKAPFDAAKTLMSPGGQYRPGDADAEGVALGVEAASVVPMGSVAKAAVYGVEPDSLGVFGGKNAKNAPIELLAKAQRMAKEGVTEQQIWEETGWFRGDPHLRKGKWRFEIPDDGLVIDSGKSVSNDATQRFDSLLRHLEHRPVKMSHPELRKQYPGILKDTLVFAKNDPITEGSYFEDMNVVMAKGPSSAARKSVAAHEIQHVIQKEEDFPRGSSPESMRTYAFPDPEDIMKPIHGEPEVVSVLRKAVRKHQPGSSAHDFYMGQLKQAVQSMQNERAFNAYHELPGEIEARNAQTRLNLTPEQRKQFHPALTADDLAFAEALRDQGLFRGISGQIHPMPEYRIDPDNQIWSRLKGGDWKKYQMLAKDATSYIGLGQQVFRKINGKWVFQGFGRYQRAPGLGRVRDI